MTDSENDPLAEVPDVIRLADIASDVDEVFAALERDPELQSNEGRERLIALVRRLVGAHDLASEHNNPKLTALVWGAVGGAAQALMVCERRRALEQEGP